MSSHWEEGDCGDWDLGVGSGIKFVVIADSKFSLVTVLPDLPEARLKLLFIDDSMSFICSGAREKYCSSPESSSKTFVSTSRN